ncbi:SDR family oxidoreductase [Hoeflea sp. AS16]|uniref:SDR family oxidoreductase n=1 Tax=Hoeflea sp. AS16 TaxID=3135779 RepID=UPI00316B6ECB
MSKIILVTGTSTGLGISIAIQAAQAGHTVYATMRNLEKRENLDAAATAAGVSLKVLPLDVSDSASVNAAVAEIIANEGRIDVLVNNAGAGFVRTVEQATEAEIQGVMDVNFTGVARCIKAVMPHMREARSGHIVTISSVGGLVGQPFNEIYCAAKFAVEGMMEAMASYITPNFGINFTLVEPGGIATEFVNNVMAHVVGTGGILDDEYKPILQAYIGGSQARSGEGEGGGRGGQSAYQTADEVAEVVIGTIQSGHPPLRTRTSQWGETLCHLKTALDPDGLKLTAQVTQQFLG